MSTPRILTLVLANALTGALALGSSTGAATPSLASAPNPYAQHVARTSNEGLEQRLLRYGPADADRVALDSYGPGLAGSSENETAATSGVVCAIPSLPTLDDDCTDGWICNWLTYAPASGCIETAFDGCTDGTCTDTNCTTSNTCTKATECTNTPGHTDKGICTKQTNCTGGEVCTQSAGCTQGGSCTGGENCTQDTGVCTGGPTCTSGTGCTNGTACTAGNGCTGDAQCTKGPVCTSENGSSLCTNGNSCTTGNSCPTSKTQCPDLLHSGTGTYGHGVVLRHLDEPGVRGPESDPHSIAPPSLASLSWLLVLLAPTLMRRREDELPG